MGDKNVSHKNMRSVDPNLQSEKHEFNYFFSNENPPTPEKVKNHPKFDSAFETLEPIRRKAPSVPREVLVALNRTGEFQSWANELRCGAIILVEAVDLKIAEIDAPLPKEN